MRCQSGYCRPAYDCDCGAPEVKVLARRMPRARIEHPCSRCSAGIKFGESYHLTAGTIDGEWFTDKFHARPCNGDDYY